MIKIGKSDYNREIKEYNNLNKIILNEEKSLEMIENKFSKIKQKQKLFLSSINNDFLKHFKDLSSRINSEIIEVMIEFFGFKLTPFNLLTVKFLCKIF